MRRIKIRIFLFLFFIGLFMAFGATAAGNNASITVATDASGPESTISKKGGRSAYFLFFDSYGYFLAAERNPFADVSGGAGPKVAGFLSTKGVSLVIAEEFGNKMARFLDSYKIKYIQRTGVAHEVVQAIIDDK